MLSPKNRLKEAFVIVVCFLSSCTSLLYKDLPVGNVKRSELKKWQSTVDGSMQTLRTIWNDDVDWRSFEESKVPITEANINNIKLVSGFSYRIDSVGFFNYTPDIDPLKILKLETDKATLWALNDTAKLITLNPYLKDGQWEIKGYGYGSKVLSQKLFELISSGKKVHEVNVYASTPRNIKGSHDSIKQYLVFYDDGKLLSVDYYGYVRTFNQRLLSLKEAWIKRSK